MVGRCERTPRHPHSGARGPDEQILIFPTEKHRCEGTPPSARPAELAKRDGYRVMRVTRSRRVLTRGSAAPCHSRRAGLSMRPMRLVLFDIDGTILHTHGAGRRAVHRALHEV